MGFCRPGPPRPIRRSAIVITGNGRAFAPEPTWATWNGIGRPPSRALATPTFREWSGSARVLPDHPGMTATARRRINGACAGIGLDPGADVRRPIPPPPASQVHDVLRSAAAGSSRVRHLWIPPPVVGWGAALDLPLMRPGLPRRGGRRIPGISGEVPPRGPAARAISLHAEDIAANRAPSFRWRRSSDRCTATHCGDRREQRPCRDAFMHDSRAARTSSRASPAFFEKRLPSFPPPGLSREEHHHGTGLAESSTSTTTTSRAAGLVHPSPRQAVFKRRASRSSRDGKHILGRFCHGAASQTASSPTDVRPDHRARHCLDPALPWHRSRRRRPDRPDEGGASLLTAWSTRIGTPGLSRDGRPGPETVFMLPTFACRRGRRRSNTTSRRPWRRCTRSTCGSDEGLGIRPARPSRHTAAAGIISLKPIRQQAVEEVDCVLLRERGSPLVRLGSGARVVKPRSLGDPLHDPVWRDSLRPACRWASTVTAAWLSADPRDGGAATPDI